jgi:tRNA(fMet)-specific endonuclease VapC
MKVLLDTDILSELQRRKNQAVHAIAAEYERTHEPLTLSVLSVFEIVQGWHHAGRPERATTFLEWASSREVLPFDEGCARLAGEIGGALLRAGRPIGVVDVGLAATAIHHARILVTGNTAHFGYVREAGFDLTIENWREAG